MSFTEIRKKDNVKEKIVTLLGVKMVFLVVLVVVDPGVLLVIDLVDLVVLVVMVADTI